MEMDNLTQQELGEYLKGAVLVRESRSGVTQNWRLNAGQLVSVYYYKSGRIEVSPISQEDTSLTVRY